MMDGTFNGQTLVEKLEKLNSSQQSIETLSHWCIFHRKKARQVVETWDRQFHCSPQEQRVSFLYLANDILQNSRRKGFEFVGEFWKVLPGALRDVFKNGDEFGRNAVLRLVGIWDDRKVFGSRGQLLKEEFLGGNTEHKNRNGKVTTYKLKNPGGDILEKLTSSYERISSGAVDEDALFGRCQTAISYVENIAKEIGSDNLGSFGGSGIVEELQQQHGILRECIEQLTAAESSRTTFLSLLSEAIHEQETKIEQIHSQLQAAQSQYEQVGNIYQQLLSYNGGQLPPEQRLKETPLAFSDAPPSFAVAQGGSEGRQQATPMGYTQQVPFTENSPRTEEEHRKTAAAAMAAKLTSSTASAQMLSYVLSSLASEGIIGQSAKEDYSNFKRLKSENGTASYITPQTQPPLPQYPHPEFLHQPPPPQMSSSPMSQPSPTLKTPSPLPPTMPPMSPTPPPSTQFMQIAGSMTSVSYAYGSAQSPQRPLPLPGYPMAGMPPYSSPLNHYHNFQVSEAALSNHQSLPPTPPSVTRQ